VDLAQFVFFHGSSRESRIGHPVAQPYRDRVLHNGTGSLPTAIRRAKSPHTKLYGIALPGFSALFFSATSKEESMAWTTPVLVEICIGLEINGYLPADGYVPPEF
jgi:coenzyme PQQ precursor peptide PqqA